MSLVTCNEHETCVKGAFAAVAAAAGMMSGESQRAPDETWLQPCPSFPTTGLPTLNKQ